MNNELARFPTRSENVCFANNEQSLIAVLFCFTHAEHSLYIVTRNNIVWKIACGYCLCYCKTFSLVPDSTECTKIFVTEKCSTLFGPPKIK